MAMLQESKLMQGEGAVAPSVLQRGLLILVGGSRTALGSVRTRLGHLAVAVALGAVLLLLAVFEGDVPALASSVVATLPLLSPIAPFGLLYLEESGVPILMPGDVLIMYVAHTIPRAPLIWLAAWAGLVVSSTLGASTLYIVARIWGRPLVAGKLGHFLHLTPARLDRAEQWFLRWGPWAIIFGRHIFGLRVPITVAAGLFKVRYPIFALSIASSATIWVGFFLFLGATIGAPVERFLEQHHGVAAAIPGLLVAAAMFYVGYLVLQARKHPRSV